VVAAVQAVEAILARHVSGDPDCVVRVNDALGGLVLYAPGKATGEVLYAGEV
jgi:D-galacturonate reductase